MHLMRSMVLALSDPWILYVDTPTIRTPCGWLDATVRHGGQNHLSVAPM